MHAKTSICNVPLTHRVSYVFGAIFVTKFLVQSTHIYLDRFYYFSNRVTRLKIMEIKTKLNKQPYIPQHLFLE